jgi:restriction endonuclease Mrr
MTEIHIPSSVTLRDALLRVLHDSPGGLSTKEIDSSVATNLHLSEEQLSVIRSGTRTEFAYRMAWERTHAKNKGLIEKTAARTWKILTVSSVS